MKGESKVVILRVRRNGTLSIVIKVIRVIKVIKVIKVIRVIRVIRAIKMVKVPMDLLWTPYGTMDPLWTPIDRLVAFDHPRVTVCRVKFGVDDAGGLLQEAHLVQGTVPDFHHVAEETRESQLRCELLLEGPQLILGWDAAMEIP